MVIKKKTQKSDRGSSFKIERAFLFYETRIMTYLFFSILFLDCDSREKMKG